MSYSLEEFKYNGVAWPLKFEDDKFTSSDLENQYENFQKKSLETFGKKITLKPNLLSTFFDNFLDHPTILPKVKKILGENIYVWSSAIFCKAPGEGKIVSYHQDSPYWQLSNDKVVTVWIALTKCTKNSGALEVIPKTHNIGLINNLDVKNPREAYLKGEKTTTSSDMLSFNQNLDNFVKQNPPEVVCLEPGQYSIHHINTVHGSGINNSSDSRIGFAIRYVSSDTKHLEVSNDRAVYICGAKNSYYIEENRPKADFNKESIEQYKLSMDSTGVFGNKKY